MAMVHLVYVGHFKPDGVRFDSKIVTQPIDMERLDRLLEQHGLSAEGTPGLRVTRDQIQSNLMAPSKILDLAADYAEQAGAAIYDVARFEWMSLADLRHVARMIRVREDEIQGRTSS